MRKLTGRWVIKPTIFGYSVYVEWVGELGDKIWSKADKEQVMAVNAMAVQTSIASDSGDDVPRIDNDSIN